MTTPTVIGQLVDLQLRAAEEDWGGFFDRLEVWRGPLVSGPFVEITAPQWVGARIPADVVGDPPPAPPTGPGVALTGKTLSLLINERVSLNVLFSGPDPVTYAAAVVQINAQSQGLITSFMAADGRVVVQTMQPGNAAILRVLPTDAASVLGLPTTVPDAVSYGKAPRIALVSGVDVYPFTDDHSDPSFFYQTRFSNSANGDVSDFSTPFSASGSSVLDPSLLILGVIDIVDLQGRPIENREVSVSTKFTGLAADGRGVMPATQRILTDKDGHAEITLIRGMKVMVSVAGSQLTRDVSVPTDPTLTFFRLLDPGVGSNDVFVVQKPNIDFAVRRSL